MMPEEDLRDLHARLIKVLAYAKSAGVPFGPLKSLIQVKVMLEFVVGMETASARDWSAATFKAIVNLEHLQQTAERSRQARDN